MPDSSVIHAVDPKFDGNRLVVACSELHMTALWNQYQARPFDDEELWAAWTTTNW